MANVLIKFVINSCIQIPNIIVRQIASIVHAVFFIRAKVNF